VTRKCKMHAARPVLQLAAETPRLIAPHFSPSMMHLTLFSDESNDSLSIVTQNYTAQLERMWPEAVAT